MKLPLTPLNLLVMVALPLVYKDTAPLGDVKAIQTCVSCGTGEGGSSVRLRATRRSPCLPYRVPPATLIRYNDIDHFEDSKPVAMPPQHEFSSFTFTISHQEGGG